MLLIHGVYRFGARRIACRNDYCTVCKKPRLTEQHRYFAVLHVYFVPLVPLGFGHQWVCRRCGNEPQAARPNSPTMMVLGILVGVLLWVGAAAALIFGGGVDDEGSDPKALAACLSVWGVALVGLCGWAIAKEDRKGHRRRAARVAPLSATNCPYCAGPLRRSRNLSCRACNVRVDTQE